MKKENLTWQGILAIIAALMGIIVHLCSVHSNGTKIRMHTPSAEPGCEDPAR